MEARIKLSIFPSANPHPKGDEEKKQVTWQVSRPNLPETVEFGSDDELINYVTNYAWSPFVFSSYRHADNFISCDLLVYDVDDGLTIDAAEAIVKKHNLCCLCLPSPSHSEELHKFRLVLPLARTISDSEVYIETWLKGAELFGVVDPSCKDLARFYNGSTLEDGFWQEGEFFTPVEPKPKPEKKKMVHSFSSSSSGAKLVPVSDDISDIIKSIYGENRTVVPEAVEYFIRNAHTGIPGAWISSLNRFVFSLALSKVEECTILMVCESLAPEPLTKRDLAQIERSIRDAKDEI